MPLRRIVMNLVSRLNISKQYTEYVAYYKLYLYVCHSNSTTPEPNTLSCSKVTGGYYELLLDI